MDVMDLDGVGRWGEQCEQCEQWVKWRMRVEVDNSNRNVLGSEEETLLR